MATAIPPMLIEIQLETQKIKQGLDELTSRMNNFGQTVTKQTSFMEKMKSTMLGVFGGNLMTQGFNMLTNSIKGAVTEAQQMEVTMAKIEAILISTGNVAGVTAQSLQENASALESLTAVDEMAILSSEQLLATFTKVRNVAGEGNDIFNQTTKAALDMSAALGTDLTAATSTLGRALSDPEKGMLRLQRAGIKFTEEQKKMVSAMIASGDTLGAQKEILKAIEERYGGAAEAAGDTFAGAVFRLKDKLDDFMRTVVTQAQPILLALGKTLGDLINKYIAPLVGWLQKNKAAVATFVTVLGTGIAVLKAYKVIMATVTAFQELYLVATVLMTGGKLADVVATENATRAQLMLNAAMTANPIGLIVAALALLAAGFVYAWNHSETFRKVIITIAKGVVSYIAFMIRAWGGLIEIILKVVTGPMRLFLNVLQHLPGIGKYAKQGLDLINNGIEGVGDFAESVAKKVEGFTGTLDKLQNKKINIPGFGGKDEKPKPKTGKEADLGPTAEQIAKEKQRVADVVKAQQDVADIYKKMNDVIKNAQSDAADALEARGEANTKAEENRAKRDKDIWENYAEDLAANKKRYDKEVINLNKNHAKELVQIAKDLAKKLVDIEASLQEKIADLRAKSVEKTADLTKAAADKQIEIIKQSQDRLRSAFASSTGAALDDAFNRTGGNADKLIKNFERKLSQAKDLQAHAAKLAGMGYSQVFIEEVVKNGPQVGGRIAAALEKASPEATAKLQALYGQVEEVSNHGLDALATTMNAGGKLATEELMTAYSQVAVDLKTSLEGVNKELNTALAGANADYAKAVAQAQADSIERIADAKAKLDEQLADAKASLDEANQESLEAMKKALAKSAQTLQDDLIENQKAYEKSIDAINKATREKLAALQQDLKATAVLMLQLGEAKAAAAALAAQPIYTPIAAASAYKSPTAGQSGFIGPTINQTFNSTSVNSAEVTNATISAIKYGTTVNTTTLAGITAASATPKLSGADAVAAARQRNGGYL